MPGPEVMSAGASAEATMHRIRPATLCLAHDTCSFLVAIMRANAEYGRSPLQTSHRSRVTHSPGRMYHSEGDAILTRNGTCGITASNIAMQGKCSS